MLALATIGLKPTSEPLKLAPRSSRCAPRLCHGEVAALSQDTAEQQANHLREVANTAAKFASKFEPRKATQFASAFDTAIATSMVDEIVAETREGVREEAHVELGYELSFEVEYTVGKMLVNTPPIRLPTVRATSATKHLTAPGTSHSRLSSCDVACTARHAMSYSNRARALAANLESSDLKWPQATRNEPLPHSWARQRATHGSSQLSVFAEAS